MALPMPSPFLMDNVGRISVNATCKGALAQPSIAQARYYKVRQIGLIKYEIIIKCMFSLFKSKNYNSLIFTITISL